MSLFSSLISLARFKCPKCHKGDMFVNKNPFNLKMLTTMPEKCPHCGQLMELEPGFYYGAMYCSYGISVGLFLLNFFLFYIILEMHPVWFMVLNTVLLLVMWPVIFRYARAIYLYLFVRFDPGSANAKINEQQLKT